MALGSLSALRLMWDYLNGRRVPRSQVTETTILHSPQGHPWLLYSPTGPQLCPMTLIHGVTAHASEDVNLVHLARCIASLGHPCLTPPLDGLAHFIHTDTDVTIVADAFQRALDLFRVPTGVWAFSYGASYALSAAARPKCREACRFIAGFGAYYRLESALEHQRQLLERNPDPIDDDSDLLYLRYTLLVCQRKRLSLPASAWTSIETALADFMLPTPLHEKRQALLQYARHIDYVDLMANYQRHALSSALSPAGHLQQVACPVALLHDPKDRFIPPDQVQLIQNELDCRDHVPKTRTLTTPMLSHVRVDPMRNLYDAWQLIRLLSPLFETHTARGRAGRK